MQNIGKSCLTLLLFLATRPGQAEEPKFFLEKNLDQAHDILHAGLEGCTLKMQISSTRKASEAIDVEIDLINMDSASITLDERMGLSLAAKGQATPVRVRAGDNVHSESRYRVYVGDRNLASKLAENLAQVVAICNLYDCPEGKLFPEDTASGDGPVSLAKEENAAPSPPLSRQEIDAALPLDTELVEQVMSWLRERRKEKEEGCKAAIRRLPILSSEERDALREEYGLPRRSAMTRDQTAFNRALEGARYGKPELVLDYLHHGGKIDHPATDKEYRSSGATLLTAAVRGNELTIVRLLLKKGADVNVAGDWGKRPVDLAADDERLPILQALLDAKARLGRNEEGNTPLWNAAASGEVGAIKLLLAHGANPDEPGSYDEPPLSRAAGNGYKEAVQALLAGGARITAPDKDGITALHSAILGSLDVVQLLVEQGADVNQIDGEGLTPLDRASSQRSYDIVNYLRSHGALSAGDLLRQAWAVTRPTLAAPAPRPRKLRPPCAEGTSTRGLANLWDDPEYQSFIERLRPWVPPLKPEEASGPAVELVTAGWSAMAEYLQAALPALAQGDLGRINVVDPALLEGGRRMLAISGRLLSEKNRLADLKGDQLFTAVAMLQIGLATKYRSEKSVLDYERARELYDLKLSASDLFGTLIPCDSLSEDARMTAGFLGQIMAIAAPPIKLLDVVPPTTRDFEHLREHLRPWLVRLGVDARTYSIFDGGLPGHISAEQADAFRKTDEGRLPYLALFYRPENQRGRAFSCTPFEEALVGHNTQNSPTKELTCRADEVEVGLLAKLIAEAGETGEPLDDTRRYESLFVLAFLARYYGNLMDEHSPGLRSTFIQWASSFVQSLDLIDRPDAELSPAEVLVKELALRQYRDPRRARDLYAELRELYSY